MNEWWWISGAAPLLIETKTHAVALIKKRASAPQWQSHCTRAFFDFVNCSALTCPLFVPPLMFLTSSSVRSLLFPQRALLRLVRCNSSRVIYLLPRYWLSTTRPLITPRRFYISQRPGALLTAGHCVTRFVDWMGREGNLNDNNVTKLFCLVS